MNVHTVATEFLFKKFRTEGILAIEAQHDTPKSSSTIKSVPFQSWSGPEGSKKLRFPDFMTTAQEGGKVVNLMQRPHLPPGNSPGTHFC